MEDKIDFTSQRHFPGSVGNPFDILLHRMTNLDRLPGVIFGGLLLILAILGARFDLRTGLLSWAFMLGDWALLAALPRADISYGPPKPAVTWLAIARTVVALLPFPPAVAIGLQGIGTLLVIYGFWIEPQRLTLTRQTLTTDKLPQGTQISLLHLGDLHIERITARERHLNRYIAALKPDLIAFTGDFLNLSYLRDPQAWQAARAVVREWRAPLGVYAVTGSPAVDLEDVMPGLLDDLPLRWLRDEMVNIPVGAGVQVNLVGLSCSHKPFIDAPRLKTILTPVQNQLTVLLYHSPDLAPDAAELGVDMQLSGHTHGGQVRLPIYGPLFTASLYGRRFQSGRYLINRLVLYITRGIGLEGAGAPRVRFLCSPEIILWTIEGSGIKREGRGIE